ncbi:MAG: hypothetical protein RLZZ232_1809 [Planctomycetota bacterium]
MRSRSGNNFTPWSALRIATSNFPQSSPTPAAISGTPLSQPVRKRTHPAFHDQRRSTAHVQPVCSAFGEKTTPAQLANRRNCVTRHIDNRTTITTRMPANFNRCGSISPVAHHPSEPHGSSRCPADRLAGWDAGPQVDESAGTTHAGSDHSPRQSV